MQRLRCSPDAKREITLTFFSNPDSDFVYSPINFLGHTLLCIEQTKQLCRVALGVLGWSSEYSGLRLTSTLQDAYSDVAWHVDSTQQSEWEALGACLGWAGSPSFPSVPECSSANI